MGLVARHYLRHYPLRLPGHGADGHRDAGQAAAWSSARTASRDVDGPAGDPRPGQGARRPRPMTRRYLYYPGCSMERHGARPTRDSLDGDRRAAGPRPAGDRRLELLRRDRVPRHRARCAATPWSRATWPSPSAQADGAATARRAVQRRASSTWPRRTTTCASDPIAGRDTSTTALGAAGLHYTPGTVEVRHLFEVARQRRRRSTRSARTSTRPLHGLRVAPYLGCLVTRPDHEQRWTSHGAPARVRPAAGGARRRGRRLSRSGPTAAAAT